MGREGGREGERGGVRGELGGARVKAKEKKGAINRDRLGRRG